MAAASDESLVEGWMRLGSRLPDSLSGRFAFAVADWSRHEIVLIRDPMGEVPLYYFVGSEGVTMSDDLTVLAADPEVPTDLDMEAIALRLARCFGELRGRTDFRHIRAVPPGTIVRVNRGGVREETYWQPSPAASQWSGTFADAVDHGEALLREAVEDRLSDSVAVHLSGGLDSSLVAALTATLTSAPDLEPPRAYSWSPDPLSDWPHSGGGVEYDLVRAVASRYGLPVTFVEPASLLTLAAGDADPLLDPPMAWLIESQNAADAAARGVSTILTGWGGDEGLSFHSRTASAELLRSGHPVRAWHASAAPPGLAGGMRRRLSRMVALRPTPYDPEVDAAWRRYSPDIADARLDAVRSVARARTTQAGMLARLRMGHVEARNASWHRGGRRVGVTYASPLQDRHVIDFALSLPPEYFTYGGVHRRIFRAIAQRYLPPEVVRAPKTYPSEPAREYLSGVLAQESRKRRRAAMEQLSWPPELIDAADAMFAPMR